MWGFTLAWLSSELLVLLWLAGVAPSIGCRASRFSCLMGPKLTGPWLSVMPRQT